MSVFRPQYMRNLLPVSSLGAQGATPSAHSLPNTAPFPVDPVQRVAEAIRLRATAVASLREHDALARARRQQLQAPPPQEMQISTPSPPRTGETATSSQSYEVVPHLFEGNDSACSLCQEEFEHGQRVCRLTCRTCTMPRVGKTMSPTQQTRSTCRVPIVGAQDG